MLSLKILFNRTFNRFAYVFHESPAWAEATSAFAGLLYVSTVIVGLATGSSQLDDYKSLYIIRKLFEAEIWIAIAFCFSLFQFVVLFTKYRVLRALAAFFMLIWYSVIVWSAIPLTGIAPVLAFPSALWIPNFFAIARHARDWGKNE